LEVGRIQSSTLRWIVLTGCALICAASSHRPLFGVIGDERLWRAACFEVLEAFHDTHAHFCAVCRY
jgi:hypothetical protein